MNSTITTYNQHAKEFNRQYLSTSAEEVHSSWINDTFKAKGGQALDVGAGD